MSKRARQQGELEKLILDVLWDAKNPLTSHEILEVANKNSDLALTTILTVLSRLEDTGLILRQAGEGRAFLFTASQSREQHTADMMLQLFSNSSNPALAFSHFADGLSPSQLKALRKSLEG
jgi:predicted transcriptional regulator